jgi:oligosaccharide translocation protein RFT1
MGTEEVLKSSARGASYMMALVMAQRIVTFLFNALLLRVVSVDVVGFASNDMELLVATLLFLSREACRLVALRAPIDTLTAAGNKLERQRLINIAWLPVPLGLLLASGAAWVHRRVTAASADKAVAGEHTAFYIFCLAAFVETFAEPFFILSQSMLLYGVRARTEIAATLARCGTSLALALVTVAQQPPAWLLTAMGSVVPVASIENAWTTAASLLGGPAAAFAVGQLVYATVVLAGFASAVVRSNASGLRGLLPAYIPLPSGSGHSLLDIVRMQFGAQQVGLWFALSGQSLVKHVLTEADRLLLAIFADRSMSGSYAVVTNYGSLAPRLLFQPIEESMRGLFSKLVPSASAPSAVSSSGAESDDSTSDRRNGKSTATKRSKKEHASSSAEGSTASDGFDAQSLVSLQIASKVLVRVLKLVLLVGLVFALLASAYTHTLVAMMLGSKWVEAGVPQQLAIYCVYVLFLAVNGITEAFATSAADSSRLHAANGHLVAAFLLYACVVAALMPHIGTSALIIAGCVNLAVRSLSSLQYARRVTRSWADRAGSRAASSAILSAANFSEALPRMSTAIAFALAGVAVHASNIYVQRAAASSSASPSPGSASASSFSTFVAVLRHLTVGVLAAAAVVLALYSSEKDHLLDIWGILRGRAQQTIESSKPTAAPGAAKANGDSESDGEEDDAAFVSPFATAPAAAPAAKVESSSKPQPKGRASVVRKRSASKAR